MLRSTTPSYQHRKCTVVFWYAILEDAEKHRIRVRFPLPEVEAAVGLDEMWVGSLVVQGSLC